MLTLNSVANSDPGGYTGSREISDFNFILSKKEMNPIKFKLVSLQDEVILHIICNISNIISINIYVKLNKSSENQETQASA